MQVAPSMQATNPMQTPDSLPPAAILTADWPGLTVEYGRLDAVGEFDFAMPKQALSVAFTPHDRVVWSVDQGKKQTTALPAGTVFLYADRELIWHHRAKSSEFINLTLDPAILQQIAADSGLPAETGFDHRVMFQDATVVHVAQLLRAEVLNGGLAGNLYVESLRNLLAVHLLRNYSPVNSPAIAPTSSPSSALDFLTLKRLKDYIEDHLAEELAIETLAELVPMSQFHFARAFKSVMGEPPHRYVLQRRIERAKVLLSATRLSVAEIAYQVGFSNQSHFTAQFRKTVGATPKQFRDS
ncbi:MAG: AraC family transcriptional regulator [Oculatellaceae cyanobacterium Prado106]|jgi:AraC family transcriptional regulator|nr:AraC family transcriptional regulator [Oculatellaceae cyanobacterium Prado106]